LNNFIFPNELSYELINQIFFYSIIHIFNFLYQKYFLILSKIPISNIKIQF